MMEETMSITHLIQAILHFRWNVKEIQLRKSSGIFLSPMLMIYKVK